tara:strand:- start:973 stop:1227 length:255 start_codon:yes stop_codon:yes gene_type:complete
MCISTYSIKLKKTVMGLIDKIRKKEEAQKKHLQPNSEEDLFLNKEDLKYLLTLIKDSTFQGREIEIIYNLTLKLQKAYSTLNKS